MASSYILRIESNDELPTIIRKINHNFGQVTKGTVSNLVLTQAQGSATDDLSDDVVALSGRIDTLNGNITSLQNNIDAIASTVDSLQNQIEALDERVSALEDTP